jgi:hypothetical protein
MRKFLVLSLLSIPFVCFGDTLTLKNGDTVEGTYLGGTARVLRMEVNGHIQTFDISMVNGLQFSSAQAPGSSSSGPALRRAPNSGGDSGGYSSSQPGNSQTASDGDRPILRRSPQTSSDDSKILRPDDPYSNSTAPSAQPPSVELPPGTQLTVRMIDSVD